MVCGGRGVTEVFLHLTRDTYPLNDIFWNILDSVAIGMWDGATSDAVKGFWELDSDDNSVKKVALVMILAGFDGGLSSLIQDAQTLRNAKNWHECEPAFERAYTAAGVAAGEKFVSLAVDGMNLPEHAITDISKAVLEPIAMGIASIVGRANVDFVDSLFGLIIDMKTALQGRMQ